MDEPFSALDVPTAETLRTDLLDLWKRRAHAGYRHGAATDGSAFNENRLLAEQTFRLHLPSKVIADYRTREDFRRLNSGFSVRLRERLQIQRDFTIADYTFTPYASSEVFLTRAMASSRAIA